MRGGKEKKMKTVHFQSGGVAVAFLLVLLSSPVTSYARPDWTEWSSQVIGDDLYTVGVATGAHSIEEGRTLAFEAGKLEILNYSQLSTLDVVDIVIETQRTYEEENDDDTFTVYRLLVTNRNRLIMARRGKTNESADWAYMSKARITPKAGSPIASKSDYMDIISPVLTGSVVMSDDGEREDPMRMRENWVTSWANASEDCFICGFTFLLATPIWAPYIALDYIISGEIFKSPSVRENYKQAIAKRY